MKNKTKRILGVTGLATAILLSGCTNNIEKINNENVIEIGTSKLSLDKVKENAEINSSGKLSVTEGVLSTVLSKYYIEKVDKDTVKKYVQTYKENIEKSSKQTISDSTVKEIERTVRKNLMLNEAQNDLIDLDVKEIEKEQKEGYKLVRVVYGLENGEGSAQSKKELADFKTALAKAKKDNQIQKVITAYSKSTYITTGILVLSKDLSNFDEKITKELLTAKKGYTAEWETADSTKTKNMAYVIDSWKASSGEILMYKKGAYVKKELNTDIDLLKALDKDNKDFKISDTLYDFMKDELEGKVTVDSGNKDDEKTKK